MTMDNFPPEPPRIELPVAHKFLRPGPDGWSRRMLILRRLHARFMMTLPRNLASPDGQQQPAPEPEVKDIRAAIFATARFFDASPIYIAQCLTMMGLIAPPQAYPKGFVALVREHTQSPRADRVSTLLEEPDGEGVAATAIRLIDGPPNPALRALGAHWIASGQAEWKAGDDRPYIRDELAAELRARPHLARVTQKLLEQARDATATRPDGDTSGRAGHDLDAYGYTLLRYIEMFQSRYTFCREALLAGANGRIEASGTIAIIGQLAAQYAVSPDYVATRLAAHPDFSVPSLAHLPQSFVAMVRAHDQLAPPDGDGYYRRPFADYTTLQGIFGRESVCRAPAPHPFYRALAERWRREGLAADWPPQKPLPPDIHARAASTEKAAGGQGFERYWDRIAARHLTPAKWADHAHEREPFTEREITRLFAGRKVDVTHRRETLVIGGKETAFDYYTIAPDDATMRRLNAAADKAGFRLRPCLPGKILGGEEDPGRLNVHIKNAGDNDWRIDGFTLG